MSYVQLFSQRNFIAKYIFEYIHKDLMIMLDIFNMCL